MEITAALAADLALLTAAAHDPGADPASDLADTVLVLAADARLAVRSFAGLTVTIARLPDESTEQVLLRFMLLDDHREPSDITTSLRLPSPTDSTAPDQSKIEMVLYATTPGAFVDLAAHLSFLTSRPFADADLDQHRGLAGESDTSGLLHARTEIGEAIGVLVAQGRTREQASAELDALAEAASTGRAAEASRILSTLTCDGAPHGSAFGASDADLT